LLRLLCSEPLKFRPWDVAKLTPFQARVLLTTERDKQGNIILDPPAGEPVDAELSLADEWEAEFTRRGVTDPDALRLMVDDAVASDVWDDPLEGDDDA